MLVSAQMPRRRVADFFSIAMTILQPSQLRPIQDAWDALSSTFRLYGEARHAARPLLGGDIEDAVSNLDRAFEQKLEKFHTLYDLTRRLKGFEYFGRADTSLVLTLRNAVHHRDHDLFVSWNRQVLLEGGLRAKAGAAYLVGSAHPFEDEMVARFLYPLQDFYRRLETGEQVKEPAKLRALWNADLRFGELAHVAERQGYPCRQVYVDVVPPLMSAMRTVVGWLQETSFTPRGPDGETFFTHFGFVEVSPGTLFTEEVRIPIWA